MATKAEASSPRAALSRLPAEPVLTMAVAFDGHLDRRKLCAVRWRLRRARLHLGRLRWGRLRRGRLRRGRLRWGRLRCSAAEVGGAFPAGVSLVVAGCGGRGAVCAQAPALSEETRKDVDKSNLDRNAIRAPRSAGIQTTPIHQSAQATRTHFWQRLRQPLNPHAELLVDCHLIMLPPGMILSIKVLTSNSPARPPSALRSTLAKSFARRIAVL